MNPDEQRYTLSLPTALYDELRTLADKHRISIKEIVRRSIKIGLIVIKMEEEETGELYLKERIADEAGDGVLVKETRIKFVL